MKKLFKSSLGVFLCGRWVGASARISQRKFISRELEVRCRDEKGIF